MTAFLRGFLVLIFVGCVVTAVYFWQGLHSLVFAWVLNFMLMVAVLYLTEHFKPRLTSTYYNRKNWEAGGKVYYWLGVDVFRKILVWVGWEKLNKSSNPVKKNLDALNHLEYRTRQSEFGHLIIFMIVLSVTLFVAINYGARQSVWLVITNVLLNAYPIAVQRYNRPRLESLLKRYSKVN